MGAIVLLMLMESAAAAAAAVSGAYRLGLRGVRSQASEMTEW